MAAGFRRLRAASDFAHGGKVTKTPPGTAPDEHFVLIVAFPRTPFTGVTPWGGQNISGAQNLSGFLRFLPGHWALGFWKIGVGAVQLLRLSVLNQRSRCGAGGRPKGLPYAKSKPLRYSRRGGACPSRRSPEPHLSPTHTKARFPPEGAPPKGYRTLSGSGNRTETSQLNHPRLCDDRQGGLIGALVKRGPGVGVIGAGAAQPVLSLCAHPWRFFGSFLPVQKGTRPAGRNPTRP